MPTAELPPPARPVARRPPFEPPRPPLFEPPRPNHVGLTQIVSVDSLEELNLCRAFEEADERAGH